MPVIHFSDRMIELNKTLIRQDVSELCRNWRLMRETKLPGMRELYRGYIRNLAKHIRISRENLEHWESM